MIPGTGAEYRVSARFGLGGELRLESNFGAPFEPLVTLTAVVVWHW